jgi:hypothetical protein
MRITFLIVLFHVSFSAMGQRVDFRNDSLFINNIFINWTTSKSTLDSLLHDKGKVKKAIAKYIPGTNQPAKWTQIIYNKKGLIFRKSEHDTSSLLVAIKLYKNMNPEVDQTIMSTKTFNGDLFIDINYMNDKRRIDQLKKLTNCLVSYKESTSDSHPAIIFCNILYQKRKIRALFDYQTNDLTCIFID